MTNWDIRELAQEKPPVSSDDEMDLGSVPPPRDRGQTFSQSKINAADRESLMRDLDRLNTVFNDVRETRTPLTRVQKAEAFPDPPENENPRKIECSKPTEAAPRNATEINGANRKGHARRPSVMDYRPIQVAPMANSTKDLYEPNRDGNQAQKITHLVPSTTPEKAEKYTFPSKPLKSTARPTAGTIAGALPTHVRPAISTSSMARENRNGGTVNRRPHVVEL
ncbi:hypothetical protein PCANC_25987 [Puccinia coronata f. sp. avenae]|uniref:Uncharacterized protein n=1 Tax=Puccinia coronata f. sp. avenae TaxID=200324 RepID=A0A2N5TR32_9BASI|nr:hypothetical protein PCANC_25987 [Puccinia coronata f. sp. avenae]